ncbi:MAG: SsrA-binding protein SmpB [bacterium]|nr:SsrA-binding protein SmpB [bacterium]
MALASNKKAYFDYEILEKFEAGIELFGYEVKAIRRGDAKLDGARVIVRGSEAFLIGGHVPPYQSANTPSDYDVGRTRKLLLGKKELSYLAGKEHEKGLTLVPISLYNKGRNLKLEFGVGRGKKKFDKRDKIKKRESDRNISRTLKYE